MKKLILPVLLLLSYVSFGQLWTEDFSGEANNATTGTAGGTLGGTWSVTTLPSGGAASFSRQNPFGVELFRANQTGTEGVWNSGSVDISGTGMAEVSLNLITAGTNSTDYIRAYYKVDGGSEILFAELLGTGLSITSPGSAIISGSSLEVIVRGMENTPGNTLFGFGPPNAIGFDDLSISAVPVVYSRASTAWNVTSTWSTTGFTGPANAPSPPTTGQVAIIGGGFTVDLSADANVGGVDVRTTGTIRYTAANVDLGIEAGLARVRSGGTINRNAQAGAQIDFNQDVGGATLQVDAGGTVTIEDVTLTANASNLHYFSGGGSLTISDDILIGADDATLTNNMTTTLSVGDRIEFSAGTNNSEFVNNGTLTAATLFFDDTDNFFTNASTATFSGNLTTNGATDDDNTVTNNSAATLGFVSFDANGADLTLLNSGTINQTGTFLNIPGPNNAFNDINNLAGATWNYSGTGHDTDVNLFANNPTNSFNYILSGAQQVIAGSYNNLTLQSASAAAKTALGNFSVSGNYTRSGSATFTNGGFTVTLDGASAQTVSAVGGEAFAGLTINNTYGTSPQITLGNPISVSSVLTMTDGNMLTSATNLLTILNAATSTVGSASSYIDGPIQYNMAVSGTTRTLNFPIGKDGSYGGASVAVRHGSATSYSYTAEIIASSATALGFTLAGTTDRVSSVRYWNIKRGLTASPGTTDNTNITTTGGNGPRLTLYYTSIDGVNQTSSLTLVKSTGITSPWLDIGGTATGTPSGNIAMGAASANFTTFSYFTLANETGGTNPLPIELLHFTAKVENDKVELDWATASELNNDFFTIERASNIEKFEAVGDAIDGKGTTNVRSDYHTQDNTPTYGRSYYRLKQTDFDGKFTYSDLQVVNYEGPRFASLQVYPNPSKGNTLTVLVTGLKDQSSVPVQIYNVQGQKVYDRVLDVNTPGTLKYEVEFSSPLKQGLYIIKAGQTLQLTQRIIID